MNVSFELEKDENKEKGTLTDYVKANRKGSREAEIEAFSRPLNHHRVHLSKKVYNRKKIKADDNRQPYSFMIEITLYQFKTGW